MQRRRQTMKVAVIGAGVAGLVCATELSARGIGVSVYERGPGIGAQSCSWYAGGMLAPWCEGESAEEPVVRLGAEAIGWWRRHTDGVTCRGSLVLAGARDAAELARFARHTENYQRVDEAAIAALEPDLAGRYRSGLFFPEEAHLDPRLALAYLAAELQRRDVNLHFDAPVQAPALAAEHDFVIDCRGLSAREDSLDDLRGVKGEMLLIRSREIHFSRSVRLLHPRIPLYIVPRAQGLYMVGATMIESLERERISVRSMLELLGAAYALHPAFAEAEIVEIGVDARPAYVDNLPRIRRRGRILFVNGLYRHGYLMAPALARMVAEAMLDDTHIPEMMDEHNP